MNLLASLADGTLLGAFIGVQLMLIVLSVLVAGAYGDRVLLWHSATMGASVGAVLLQGSAHAAYMPQALMLLMAVAGLQLRALTAHVGSLRQRQHWSSAAALLIAALAAVDLVTPWLMLPAATAVWIVLATLVTLRAWPQSRPWILWLVPGQVALAAAAVRYGLVPSHGDADPVLAGVLAFGSVAIYLASVWRSRVFGESRTRQAVAETLNPLTGLSTPVVLMQRIEAARALMRRYGHPSTLLLVHVDHLASVSQRLGAETAEAAALEAGTRIRDALGAGDAAARLGFQRFAVLCEGTAPREAAANLASRILSGGLRAPLSVLPGNYLHFRIAMADLPREGVVIAELVDQLRLRLDADVARQREKRIRVVSAEELRNIARHGGVPQAVPTTY